MPIQFLICPDKFKDSLDAYSVASAMRDGLVQAIPEAICDLAPIADGGEGTLDALLAGVPVYVIEEGVAWRRAACPDSPLGKHYEACEAKLRSFGVRFVPAAKLAGCAAADDVKKAVPAACVEVPADAPCVDLRSKKVLSERDLQDVCSNGCGEILVAARAIITPLGLDWLRLKGISVRREGTK